MINELTNHKYFEYFSLNQEINGIVVISHGMAEHIGRYHWLIKKLNQDGYHVLANDHRGHGINITNGMTPGFFSSKNGWNKVGNDLVKTINIANNINDNLNCYLLAHSMGSWIALSLLDKELKIDGLILTGSSKLPKLSIYLQLLIVKLEILINGYKARSKLIDNMTLRKFNSLFKPNKTPNDWISSDLESVNNYTNDPLCGFIVTNSLWNDLCKGFLQIFNKNFYHNINSNIPILIMSGRDDAANNSGKLATKLYEFLSSIFKNISIEIIENARHEIFTELNKNISYDKFLSFIKNT